MSLSSIILLVIVVLVLMFLTFLLGIGVGLERGEKRMREKVPGESAYAGNDLIERHIVATVQKNMPDGHFDASIDRAIRRNNRRRQA